MFQGLSLPAHAAKSWPFEQARNLLARILKRRLASDAERDLAFSLINSGKTDEAAATFPALMAPVLLETGYGPSGLPHIGTFGEVARTTMVRAAFRALTDDVIPTRLISFSDDMDGLRKVPPNVPNGAMLAEDLDKPLTVVRDPYGEHASFGHHNNARLRAFLDGFGFDYTFVSSTDCYRDGTFDKVLLIALERFDAIQKIMLPSLGEERRATYSPFLPISPRTGKVLQVPTLERHVDRGSITFRDEDGTLTEVPVTGGHVKMQWRPDWAMRWTALGVDYEMSGKDLIDSVRLSNQVCRVLGGEPPEGFHYELFMDENNQKISKTKGNGLTMEDWLRYGAPESLAYYMFQSPRSAKRLFFDVIPKAMDEYLQHLNALKTSSNSSNQLDNPAWHVRMAMRPPSMEQAGSAANADFFSIKIPPVSFSLMLNLASAANTPSPQVLQGFVSRYAPDASPENDELLKRMGEDAVHYYEDFVLPSKSYRAPSDKERAAMEDLLARLRALPPGCQDGELIQNEVYAAGKDAGFEPLRAWFTALYEVLLGQSQGPRFGSFVAIYGVAETISLIERALRGEDLAA